MSSFFADENSIVQLSPNLEIEINPDPCFKFLAGTTLFSPILSPSPERQSVIRNRPSPGNNTRNDNIEETNYSESSIEGLVSGTESSPLTTIERSVERKRRENEESEQLAWDMMREESLSAYRMQMDFIASSANEMSAEDLEAIQMAMGGNNSYADLEQEQEDVQDDEGEGQDENQDSDVDQWDYDRLLALGEVIGGKNINCQNSEVLQLSEIVSYTRNIHVTHSNGTFLQM